MRRPLLLTLLTPVLAPVLAVGLSVPVAAQPPPCAEPKSLAKELRAASLVFEGEVRRIDEQSRELALEVKVSRVYRGEDLVKRVTVLTPATRADCGVVGIEKGQSWMFLSGSEGDRILTQSGDGTAEATRQVVREVEAVLGPGVKPLAEPEPPATATLTRVADDGPEDFWPLSLPGFVLVGIGLVVLAAARGLGRRADRHS